MHGTTFGGGPLHAASLWNFFDILVNNADARDYAKLGSYFRMRLTELAQKHSFIKEVRGYGLMIGVGEWHLFLASRSCWTPWPKAC